MLSSAFVGNALHLEPVGHRNRFVAAVLGLEAWRAGRGPASSPVMKRFFALGLCALSPLGAAETSPVATTASAPAPKPFGRYEELRRLPAPEAGQGAFADRGFIYAINNHTLGKYAKETGRRVASWEGGDKGPFIHLNAGIVHEGRLYGAHSNYPTVPMESSVEIFDAATLQPVGAHKFGRTDGSFTWLDRRERSTLHSGGTWIACFVHYGQRGGAPGRGPEHTRIVEFDAQWQPLRTWTLPPALIAKIGAKGYSLSGGAFGPRGLLYATGHDEPELFVLDLPAEGKTATWLGTIPITAEGQAFGWDPVESGVLYTIGRKTREVIVGRVTLP